MKIDVFYSELIALEDILKKNAYTFTSNTEDVKDLVQDTFLRAILFKDQFQENSNLTAWTFMIMRNTFINNYRRKVKQVTTLDSTPNQSIINNCSNQITTDSSYLTKEINKTIDLLNADLRVTFQLYVFGYKYKEIAEILNLKLGTVKSRIFLARKKLMCALKCCIL